MNVEDFDLGAEGASAPSDKLEVLHKALDEAASLAEAAEQMAADLAATSSALNILKTVRIPEIMAELQMDELTRNGWKTKIKDFVSGSLPKDEEARSKAIAWLEENDGGPLIKTDLNLQFAKSQHDEAKTLAAELTEKGYAAKLESGVHASTLQAFARERMRNGEPINTEVLGLYTGQVAEIKRVPEKKPKV